MARAGDHVGNYNFTVEISGAAAGYARQVLDLETLTGSGASASNPLTAGSPIKLAGLGSRFSGRGVTSGETHNVGGGNWGSSGVRLPEFRALAGLQQKYYLQDAATGEYVGLYLWQSPADFASFKDSELRASIAQAYQVVGQPRVEVYQVMMTLRDKAA